MTPQQLARLSDLLDVVHARVHPEQAVALRRAHDEPESHALAHAQRVLARLSGAKPD